MLSNSSSFLECICMLFSHTANAYPIWTYACYTHLFVTKLCRKNLSSNQSRTLCLLRQFSQIQWENEFSRFTISLFHDFHQRIFSGHAFSCPFFLGEIIFQFIISQCNPSNIGPKLMLLLYLSACQLFKSSTDLHFELCFLHQQQCIYSNVVISNISD